MAIYSTTAGAVPAPNDIASRLQAYSVNPPKTAQEYLEQQNLWNQYSQMAGADVSLKPSDYFYPTYSYTGPTQTPVTPPVTTPVTPPTNVTTGSLTSNLTDVPTTTTGGLPTTSTVTGGLSTDTITGAPVVDTTGGSLTPAPITTTGTVSPNLTSDELAGLLETSILPGIGDWAQIGTAGTGFDWSGFNYNPISTLGPNADYGDYLNRISPYSATYRPQQLSPMIGTNTAANQFTSGQSQGINFNKYVPFTLKDENLQGAINELDKALNKTLYTTQTMYTGFGAGSGQTARTLNKGKIDSDLKPFLKEVQIGKTGVSMLDAINDKDRDRILAQVSAKTGISVEDLAKSYNSYHQANKYFFDPSGANYADLMKSQAAEDVRTGITKWSKSEKNIQAANDLLARETVAKEYTGQNFGVTEQAPVKEIKDEKGNTYYAVYNKSTGTQYIALNKDAADKIAAGGTGLAFDKDSGAFYDKKDAGDYLDAAFYYLNKPSEGRSRKLGASNLTKINKMMTVDDFLPAGVTMRTATPEQIADARKALQGQIELMGTWINPDSLAKDVGKIHTANKLNLTADSAPVKKKGSFFFVNDETGKVTSVKNRQLAEWAADPVANDTPIKIKKDYYFIDKDTGEIRSTRNQFIAEGESSMKGFSQARNWESFLPAGVTAQNATREQELKARNDFTAQQTELSKLVGKGSVYNMFASENLPIPKHFDYTPAKITREFNTLVNMGINPTKIDPKLTPQNVYKKSLTYDEPDSGGFGGFVSSFIVPALSIAFPQYAPIIQGLSGAYQLSQGDIMGGLMSMAQGSGLLDKVFGGKSMLSGVKADMVNTISNSFGMSPASATKLVNAGLWAGGNAAIAALNDRNVLEALATGAGVSYLASSINNGLKTTIPNPDVRNFISQRLTTSLMSALEGGKINLEEILASGFGTGLFTDMAKKMQSKQ